MRRLGLTRSSAASPQSADSDIVMAPPDVPSINADWLSAQVAGALGANPSPPDEPDDLLAAALDEIDDLPVAIAAEAQRQLRAAQPDDYDKIIEQA